MSSINHFPSSSALAEIDLYALIRSVWKQKLLIIQMAGSLALCAGVYAFLATPEYLVTSVLRPVSIKHLDSLNRSGIYSISPESALLKVAGALESYEVRQAFYRENSALFKDLGTAGNSFEQNFEDFNRDFLRVKVDDGSKAISMPPSVSLELNYSGALKGAEVLNGFVDFAVRAERQRIADEFDVVLKNRISEIDRSLDAARAAYDIEKRARIARLQEGDNIRRAQLQDELSALRQQLKTARKFRIAQLDESIKIARSLGIIKPTAPSALGDTAYKNPTNVIRTEVNYQQIPLYFMGAESLEAERTALLQRKSDEFTEARVAQIFHELQVLQDNREIEMLKKRSNEDLFLANVEGQRSERLRLSELNVDRQALQLVDIDRYAVQPASPIRPKKSLLIVLGAVLGSILGIAVALLRYFIRSRKTAVVSPVTLDSTTSTLHVTPTKTLVHD
ncbi:Wzz/FepE/Etk N-terminal domain-containing protein [Pseudomonas sp. Au-Pse12]|uniref:Wzz/FepE/Etk N-terminal domain-containing protein n=1 Tax=Pseudomonas sp. Au-Pse12 TaxID=2906459 RepID=UPI001E51354F|nr:Wzz/FepE/Etk N-terminal domain-containing protein [Pseudomonas sp. Au-Pse12]MCE4052903.1 Wzz/FepE/Etk N-terminal domain-containing protein [Pseudomonas sp. Au-Pse12]